MKIKEIEFLLEQGIIQGVDNKEFVIEALIEKGFEVEE